MWNIMNKSVHSTSNLLGASKFQHKFQGLQVRPNGFKPPTPPRKTYHKCILKPNMEAIIGI